MTALITKHLWSAQCCREHGEWSVFKRLAGSKREPHGPDYWNSRNNEIHVKQRYKKHATGKRTVDSDGEEEVGYQRAGGIEAES